jgi:acetyl-CoA/propionyl-CoA carboxylase, biotin carboxylase, biotin carboxyl carrier protein
MPSPGTITRMRIPAGPGVRWDGGYDEGDVVSQYYDNLVGKLVVWGPDRDAARARALRALHELEIAGINTTVPAHLTLIAHPDFAAGNHSTKWVEEELDASLFASAAAATTVPTPATDGAAEPEALVERTVPVEVNGKRFSVRLWIPESTAATGTAGAPARRAARPKPAAVGGGGGGGDGTISAPMQGTIVKVLVEAGDRVEAGQAVLVLEAMKMENHINAEHAGTIKDIRVQAGDTVGTGDVLVVIE